jgi:hypothetical protein
VKPVRLRDGGDDEGALVFWEDALIAILSKLGPAHGATAGQWHVECAFGVAVERDENFADTQAAAGVWKRRCLNALSVNQTAVAERLN